MKKIGLFIIVLVMIMFFATPGYSLYRRPAVCGLEGAYKTKTNPVLKLISFMCELNRNISDINFNNYSALGVYTMYPVFLDATVPGTACGPSNRCFEEYLSSPLQEGLFMPEGGNTYLYIPLDVPCTYDNTRGRFECELY